MENRDGSRFGCGNMSDRRNKGVRCVAVIVSVVLFKVFRLVVFGMVG